MGLAASVLEVPLKEPGRVMLVTAHPDDESIFFAPTVQSLRAEKLQVMLLCLSNGVMPLLCNTPSTYLNNLRSGICRIYYVVCEKDQLIWVFGMSGNAKGLGKVRERELNAACNELRVRYLLPRAVLTNLCKYSDDVYVSHLVLESYLVKCMGCWWTN
jgi:LmbE family N-acetylglucosaminyl deacetylase